MATRCSSAALIRLKCSVGRCCGYAGAVVGASLGLAVPPAVGAEPAAPRAAPALSTPAVAQTSASVSTGTTTENADRLEADALKSFQARAYTDAEAKLRQALEIRRRLAGARDRATLATMASLAGVLDHEERLTEAAQLYADALRGQREVLGNRHPDTIEDIGLYAGVLMELGKASEAEALYVEALKVQRDTLGDRHEDTLTTLNNYAIALSAQGRYAQAEPIHAENLRLTRDLHGPDDPLTINRMNNYAIVLYDLGRLNEAAAMQAEAVRASKATVGERAPLTLSAMTTQGSMLKALGRSTEAMPIVAQALQLRREVLGSEHPDTLITLSNYAGLLEEQSRFEEAQPLFAEALRLRRKVLGPDHPETINSLNNVARNFYLQKRYKEAEPLFAEALQRNRAVLGETHPLTLTSINNYAAVLDDLGRRDEAVRLYASVLQTRRKALGNLHPDTLLSIKNYASELENVGRLAEGERLLSEAVDGFVSQLGPMHPDTIAAAADLAEIRLRLPERAADAITPIRLAVAGMAGPAGGSGGGTTGINGQSRRDGHNALIFSLHAEAAWAAGNGPSSARGRSGSDPGGKLREEAFAALQQTLVNTTSRAANRTAAIRAAARSGAGAEAAEREALIDEREVLDARIIRSFTETGPEADTSRAERKAELLRVETRLGALDDVLRRRAPDFFALIQPASLSIAQAQAVLKPDEAALIVVPARFSTQVMLVTHEGVRWHRSPLPRDRIDRLVRRLLWDVGGDVAATAVETATWGNEGSGATPYDFASAYALYHELIGPVAEGLDGKTHLFVSAAGSLSSLPLGILVSAVPQGESGDPAVLRGARWLADRIAISVMPSLQSLQFIREFRGARERSDAPGATYIGFGDPVLDGVAAQRGGGPGTRRAGSTGIDLRRVFGASTARGANGEGLAVASPAELRKLARLPETRVEIENQWAAFGRPAHAMFLGEAATETRVKQVSLSAGVISFATHGLLAGELTGAAEPGLVLTPPASATAEDDGFLTASEISALKVDAGWVILSACNTAAGDGSEGAPGLSGLSRAFFFAGATNLLVSHWPVRDDVASKLTVRAIEIARRDRTLSRAQSVQRAAREIRDNAAHDAPNDSWAHPSAWAPFSLVGDGAERP